MRSNVQRGDDSPILAAVVLEIDLVQDVTAIVIEDRTVPVDEVLLGDVRLRPGGAAVDQDSLLALHHRVAAQPRRVLDTEPVDAAAAASAFLTLVELADVDRFAPERRNGV